MVIETPYLATDGIIEVYDGERFRGIVLIERRNEPRGLALPGGFVEIGESCEAACMREMLEETGLAVRIRRLFGVYSNPARDPRFHTASAVYICRAEGEPAGGDDAKTARIIALETIPWEDLCFDHAEILKDYLLR
jgi:8-oxo-dGTP diphosphatase